ncbi:DHH family phosphoesterase [Methanobrevibacter sp. TMH8]|uniref:single-stranded-DNA-specific exonuclease RecJ n=1 Tax=Methanobrevibacter sp. TMH8 TaxID=2848611 RepID=UPI001CCD39F4|nr:DHH family phosphoesterase [Methanobrevibacter sp. TMH8]MBZ9570368.1 DHH family phosphoesterase [Methanobrevibacter sp. TMH8]
MLNRANVACDVISKHIKEDHVIRIISHNDADGLSAAGIIANAIKEEGGQFHTTILSRLRPEIVKELSREKYELFIFSDMGSACLKLINRFKSDAIIADHHQVDDIDPEDHVIHVNPHAFGIDGSKDLSGAGSSYLSIRELGEGENNKKHLAPLALVGAFGDMQCQDGFSGVNELIVEDAKEFGSLEIHEDLKVVSKSQEPMYKSLAYTLNPALPGLTGDLEGSMGFLEKIGISYGIKFTDLENEEKDILKDELIKLNPEIFGDVYSIPKENPVLRDLEEYSYILDACGKNKKTGLGLSIVLGERSEALDAALNLQKKYRDQLTKGMEWIKREGSNQMDFIQYIYSEDKVLKSVMGTISGVAMASKLLKSDKPILSMARMHNDVKVSGRTTRDLVNKGVDLGKALHDSSLSFGGQGGGHDIAAGAMIPYKEMDNFLNLVNDMVEHQLNN